MRTESKRKPCLSRSLFRDWTSVSISCCPAPRGGGRLWAGSNGHLPAFHKPDPGGGAALGQYRWGNTGFVVLRKQGGCSVTERCVGLAGWKGPPEGGEDEARSQTCPSGVLAGTAVMVQCPHRQANYPGLNRPGLFLEEFVPDGFWGMLFCRTAHAPGLAHAVPEVPACTPHKPRAGPGMKPCSPHSSSPRRRAQLQTQASLKSCWV